MLAPVVLSISVTASEAAPSARLVAAAEVTRKDPVAAAAACSRRPEALPLAIDTKTKKPDLPSRLELKRCSGMKPVGPAGRLK